MSAMLVVDMAGVVMRRVRMSGHMVVSGNCVCRGMVVMMMSVIAMIVPSDVRDHDEALPRAPAPAPAVARIRRKMIATPG